MIPAVLLVDDEPAILDIMSEELSGEFEVLLAANAEEASFYLHARPDIRAAVVDFQLGIGRDGIELLKEVEEQLPNAWRVMVTGFVSNSLPKEVVTAGVAHVCLQKPWSFGAIARTVSDLLVDEEPRLKYAL